MADNSTVKITIDIIDANSGAIVSTVIKNLSGMGAAGVTAGEQVATGAKKATTALKDTAQQGSDAAAQLGGAWQEAATKVESVATATTKVTTSSHEYAKGAGADAHALDAQYAALAQRLKSVGNAGANLRPTNMRHGPDSELANAFATMGTAEADAANLGRAFQSMGNAGSVAGNKIGNGMKTAGGHVLTNLDKVRLLRDDLGIRIPRAMENVIARSAAASAAIGAIGSGLIALGAAEIFIRMAAAAYELYKKLSDVNAETKKLAQTTVEQSQQKLFDSASLETAKGQLQQTNAEMQRLVDLRKQAGVGEDNSGSFSQYWKQAMQGVGSTSAMGGTVAGMQGVKARSTYGPDDDKKLAAATALNDIARDRLKLLQQQGQMEKLQADGSAKAASLTGAAARKAKADSDDAIAALKLQQAQTNEQYLHDTSVSNRAELARKGTPARDLPVVYDVQKDAGQSDYQASIAKNHQQLNAEATADARKQAEETLHIQAEARMAGMQGEAKYMAERNEQLRQLKEKMADTELSPINYMKRVAAVEQQYSQERLKRLETEHTETARMQAEGAVSGNTGMAKVDAQTANRIAAIDKEAPGFSDPATKAQRETAARMQGQQEQEKEAESFNERLAQYDDGRADRFMSSNQRISAEAKKTVAEIEKAWQEEYGGLDALDQRRVQSRQAVDAAEATVQLDAARQMAEARQTIVEQTMKMEDEGRRAGQSKEREQSQAIVDEYNERYRAIEELRAKDADNSDLYRRQELAAKEIENGKLLDLERQQEEKLAGMLRGFMGKHPLEALQKQGEEMSSKYLAQLIGKSSTGRSITAGIESGGMPGKKKRLPDFGSGAPAIVEAADPKKAPPVVTTSSNVSAASTTLTASAAVINVGQATFTGMGGGGAALPAQAIAAPGGAGSHASPAAIASVTGRAGVSSSPAATSTAASTAGGYGSGDSSFSGSAAGDNMGLLSGGDKGSTSFSSDVRAAAANGNGDVGTAAPAIPALGLDGGQKALAGAEKGYGMGQSVESLGKTLYGAAEQKGGDTASSAGAAGSKLGGQIGTGVSGAMGLFSAVEGNGGLGGALSGAAAGAQLGSLFGPAGTLIGAGVGALIGVIGFGGAEKAKQYEKQQVRPRIEADTLGFQMGSMDYSSAYDDLTKLDIEAQKYTKNLGPGGVGEYNNRIKSEIRSAQGKLTSEQKAGRSQYGMTAAQFDMGGPISGFGDMATGSTNGWIHAQQGEFVLQQQAALNHYQAANLINGGASHSDMASYYGAGRSAGQTTAPPPSSADVNMNFHSHDPRGTMQLFLDNKHTIRQALTESYAENSGGADLG